MLLRGEPAKAGSTALPATEMAPAALPLPSESIFARGWHRRGVKHGNNARKRPATFVASPHVAACLQLLQRPAAAQKILQLPRPGLLVRQRGLELHQPPAHGQNHVERLGGQAQLVVQAGKAGQFVGLVHDDGFGRGRRAQQANVEIGVDYMRNGTTIAAHALTADHDAAAKSLRLPIGQAGAASSPYVALSERIKKWAPFSGRREVLMISSGSDSLYYSGDLQNPYLLRGIEDAQKAGILVHSLYYESAGHYGHSYYQVNLGQSYLSRLGDETGGEAYWQGLQSPVAFAPFLDDLTKRLNNQYRLTFAGKVDKKAELQPVKVRTEKSDAELSSASRVWVGQQN